MSGFVSDLDAQHWAFFGEAFAVNAQGRVGCLVSCGLNVGQRLSDLVAFAHVEMTLRHAEQCVSYSSVPGIRRASSRPPVSEIKHRECSLAHAPASQFGELIRA